MSDCTEGVYVANKHNYAQLTNIHYWDNGAGGWSANLIDATRPFALLPNNPGVDDLVIFGINSTAINTGPFCSLVFDIETAITDVTTIVWRYSQIGTGNDPTGWTQCWGISAVQDNTNADGAMTGVAFDTVGIGSIHWDQLYMGMTAINPQVGANPALGITGYWICAHVTVAGGTGVAPTQQNRNVYSILWPYVEIDADIIGGDLPAIPEIVLRSQSDVAMWTVADPAKWHSDIVVSRRSLIRNGLDCSDFSAYLNASDVQNPLGVTFNIYPTAVDASFVDDHTCATGRSYFYDDLPEGTTRLGTWDITSTHSPQYYGKYHAYLIGLQHGGSAGDVKLSLVVSLYDVSYTGVTYGPYPFETVPLRFAVIDFGEISILPFPSALASDLVDIQIRVDATAVWDNGLNDLTLYTLVLMPVDEWAGEYLTTDYFGSLGWRGSNPSSLEQQKRYLKISGYEVPRVPVRSVCMNGVTGELINPWTAYGPPPRLLPNVAQRLWFFGRRLRQNWLESMPEASVSVEISAQQRYSSMRGDR